MEGDEQENIFVAVILRLRVGTSGCCNTSKEVGNNKALNRTLCGLNRLLVIPEPNKAAVLCFVFVPEQQTFLFFENTIDRGESIIRAWHREYAIPVRRCEIAP